MKTAGEIDYIKKLRKELLEEICETEMDPMWQEFCQLRDNFLSIYE